MFVVPPVPVLQAAKPAAAMSIETSAICDASRCLGRPELLRASPERAKTIPVRSNKNQTGRLVPGNFGNRGTDDNVCGVVARDSVTNCETSLGVIVDDGEKEAIVCGGSTVVTLNTTGVE